MHNLIALTGIALLFPASHLFGQSPTSCSGIGSRANSNGQANTCPNVNGTAMAANFNSTSYATVPVSSKTGNLQLNYAGSLPTLTPYAITRVWQTNGGSPALLPVPFGPASPPVVSGGNTQVNYCFYGSNLASLGTLSFELTDPVTGTVWGICSFDATCNSNCTVVATPAALLPVIFSSFKAVATGNNVSLEWTTSQEENNKGFTIERKIDDGDFAEIGFVPAANATGNSGNPTRYDYMDRSIPSPDGQNIGYRIRQEDLDGKFAFSSIQVVQAKAADKIGIDCNGKTVTITFPAAVTPPGLYDLLVYDTGGRTIRRLRISATSNYTIADLPAGLYHVSVNEEKGGTKTVRSVYIN